MSDLIGKTLAGRFVLEELLGTGATGSVYRAQQTSVDRIVAVKTLHPSLQKREDFKARFEIEAKAIARLNHPNCITLYDFGYDEDFDVFYMAVEYIRGKQLGEMMSEPIAQDDALAICYQVAEGLEHAHREGILHRDLKPENIMIEVRPSSGRYAVKVLDFGLARLYESKVDDADAAPSGRYQQITQAGQVYGTPAYMSPEQCRAHDELTPATDIYALGTMMFELLEGRLPFYSKSTAELIMMQMTEDPPKMDRIDVSQELRDLIHRMMLKDASARPQSVREVLTTLMPYVRLDASQEFSILPNASGELAKLTAEQIALLSAQVNSRPGPFDTPRTQTLELSSDELKSAKAGVPPIAWAAVVVVAVLLVALVAFLNSSDPPAAESVAPVDAALSPVADSKTQGEQVVEPELDQQPVEVAENLDTAEEVDPEREEPAVRPAPEKKARKPAKNAEKKGVGAVPAAKPSDDRPKTLKLTY